MALSSKIDVYTPTVDLDDPDLKELAADASDKRSSAGNDSIPELGTPAAAIRDHADGKPNPKRGKRRSETDILREEVERERTVGTLKRQKSMLQRVMGGRSMSNVFKRKQASRIDQVYRRGALPLDAYWFILNPRSTYLRRWDIYVMLLLLFTALVTPFEVAFTEPALNVMFVLNRCIDLSFFKDMCMNFITARFMEDTGKWRYTLSSIGIVYLRSWFIIDFISILPFDVVGLTLDSPEVRNLRVLRIVRLFRLLKLARIFRASRIFTRWENSISLSYSHMSLIKFMVGVLTVSHWMACVWRMQTDIDESTQIDENGDAVPLNWMTHYGVTSLTPWEQYFTSLYWAVMTITTIGYGDVVPKTTSERVVATLCMMLGASIYAYVVGAVCGIVSGLDEATSQFQSTMDNLNRYMAEYRLPQELRLDLRQYFRHCRSLSRQRHYHDLLVEMSPSLRGQVAVFCHSDWILTVPFFNSPAVEDEERESFIIQVALAIRPASFPPNESVIRMHQPASHMFILQKGVVAKHGRIISSGQFFGADVIIKNYHRPYSVRTLTYVDVFTLAREDLNKMTESDEFPATKRAIRKAAIALAFRIKFVNLTKGLGMFNLGKIRRRSAAASGAAASADLGAAGAGASAPASSGAGGMALPGTPTHGDRSDSKEAPDGGMRGAATAERVLVGSGADAGAGSRVLSSPRTSLEVDDIIDEATGTGGGGSAAAMSMRSTGVGSGRIVAPAPGAGGGTVAAATNDQLLRLLSQKHAALAQSTLEYHTRLAGKLDLLASSIEEVRASQRDRCTIC